MRASEAQSRKKKDPDGFECARLSLGGSRYLSQHGDLLCRHGVSADPRPCSGTQHPPKITACAGKPQIPPGLGSGALIAACFIQPVSPVLSFRCFQYLKPVFFMTMFLLAFPHEIFLFPCLLVPEKMWFCALFSYGWEVSGCPLK